MAIVIDEERRVFHLQTDHTSYLFYVMENGELGQLYFGQRIHRNQKKYNNLGKHEWRNAAPSWKEEQLDMQPGLRKQEYACFGKGDFRRPAYQVEQENGSRITELHYDHYRFAEGKQRLPGLPSSFGNGDDDVQTLEIILSDPVAKLNVILSYAVFPHADVIVRSTRFVNVGTQQLTLLAAFSAQIDLPDCRYDFVQFSGAWSREQHYYRSPLHPGVQSIDSLRTASSAQHNPFMMLARKTADEDQGEVFGFNLVYSGNFLSQVEVDHYQTSRVLLGINPLEFRWQLKPGHSFQTPEAVLSFTDRGMNRLSQQLSRFYRDHLVNQKWARNERPILINNWEATYFQFDEQKLLAIAQKAKTLGIELFVLDDGWFGRRDSDTTSLGDWFVDKRKFPEGLGHFSKEIHQLGMKFGLWFEPEMISLRSRLYEAHPDWVIAAPDRQMTPERHQFVLDFSREDVVDYLVKAMSKVIDETRLDYIKWDMNRHITEMFSHRLPAAEQLELPHRYILGVYRLYQRLIDKYPEVLFESCSSGGGRFDLGMMYYAPQAWTSDDTDAIERLKIQYGTSYGYSLSMMGAHVSAVPNQQTGRITSLETRGNVAFFGDLGYELDITQLSADEEAIVKKQVAFYKQNRQLFQQGTFYRLKSPFAGDGNIVSWMVVDRDKTRAIVGLYQILHRPNPDYLRLYLKGLDPQKQYRVDDSPECFYGDELMHAGLFIGQIRRANQIVGELTDFSSRLYTIKAIDNEHVGAINHSIESSEEAE